LAIDRIRIRLKAYDHLALDRSVDEIVQTVRRSGARIAGPVPLPTSRTIYTVLRSPHVDKKSREQFETSSTSVSSTSMIRRRKQWTR